MKLLPKRLTLTQISRKRVIFLGLLFLIFTTPVIVFLLEKRQRAKIEAELPEISYPSSCPAPAHCQNNYAFQVCYGFGNIDAQVLDITSDPEGEDVTEDFRNRGWLKVDNRDHQGDTWHLRFNTEPVPRCPGGYYSLWMGDLGCRIPRSGQPPLNEDDETLSGGAPSPNLALLCHNGSFTTQMTGIYEDYELEEIRIEADPRAPGQAGEINLEERLVRNINTCWRVTNTGEEDPVPSQDQLSHKYVFVIKGERAPEKHTECKDKACVQVDGPGEDACTLGDDDYCFYYTCEGEGCVKKAGEGGEPDECDLEDPEACKEPTHTECKNMACVQVEGPGGNTCTLGDDDYCYYYACEGQTCIKKVGEGGEPDDCDPTDPNACKELPPPPPPETPTHLECKNHKCAEVEGEGEDKCRSDLDCEPETHLVCKNHACTEVEGSGEDECKNDLDCKPETYLTCKNNACTEVEGSGEATCSTDADCAVGVPAQPVPVTGIELPAAIFAALAFVLLTAGFLLYF